MRTSSWCQYQGPDVSCQKPELGSELAEMSWPQRILKDLEPCLFAAGARIFIGPELGRSGRAVPDN